MKNLRGGYPATQNSRVLTLPRISCQVWRTLSRSIQNSTQAYSVEFIPPKTTSEFHS